MARYDLPFVGPVGLNESASGKAASGTTLKKVVNFRHSKRHGAGLFAKRHGVERIATEPADDQAWGFSPGAGKRLVSHGDQLLAIDAQSIWTVNEGENRLERVGDATSLNVERVSPLGHYSARNVISRAVAATSTFIVWVWVTEHTEINDPAYTVYVATQDKSTGSVSPAAALPGDGQLVPRFTQRSDFAQTVRAITLGTAGVDERVAVFWGDQPGDGTERIKCIEVTSGTSGPYVTVDGNEELTTYEPFSAVQTVSLMALDNPQCFDVARHSDGYVVTFVDVNGDLRWRYHNASHVVQESGLVDLGDNAHAQNRVKVLGDLVNPEPSFALIVQGPLRLFVQRRSNDGLTILGTFDHPHFGNVESWEYVQQGLSACVYPEQLTLFEESSEASEASSAGESSDAGTLYDGIVVSMTLDRLIDNELSESLDEVIEETTLMVLCVVADEIQESEIGVDTIAQTHRWSRAAACPWVRDRIVYVPIEYAASLHNNYGAVLAWSPYSDTTPGTPKMVPALHVHDNQIAAAMNPDPGCAPVLDGEQVHIPWPRVQRKSGSQVVLQQSLNNVIAVVGLDALTFTHDERIVGDAAHVGGVTYVGGGQVCGYDGKRFVELGFLSWPEPTQSSVEASSFIDGNLELGTRLYALVWEWTDALGNVHQSAYSLSDPLSGSGLASLAITIESEGQGVIIRLPRTLRHTRKTWHTYGSDALAVACAVYRTDANGSLLYRLEGEGAFQFYEVRDEKYDEPWNWSGTENSTTYFDVGSDEQLELTSRELIYGSGGAGEVLNYPPPPSNILVAHHDRLWGVDATDRRRVWYSKAYSTGYALATNPAMVVTFPYDVFALSTQDGNLVAFTDVGKVYTVIGIPVNNTGTNAGYESPQELSVEIRCTNARSVVSTPIGVLFQSDRGIELLPRGGAQSEWIGRSVRETFALYPNVAATLHVAAESEILLAVVDDLEAPTTGVVLVYSYDIHQWFIRDYGAPIVSLAMHRGRVCMLAQSASEIVIWRETDGFTDAAGQHIDCELQTQSVTCGRDGIDVNRLGRVHSLLSVFIEAEHFDDELLDVYESTDGGETWTDPETINFEGDPANRIYHVRQRMARAHDFRLVCRQSGEQADSEGVGLYGLMFDGKPLRGHLPLPREYGG